MENRKKFHELCCFINETHNDFDWIEDEEDLNTLNEQEKEKYQSVMKLRRQALRVCAKVFEEECIEQHHIEEMKDIYKKLLELEECLILNKKEETS